MRKNNVAAFLDDNGKHSHLVVVATLDFLPEGYIGNEEGRYVINSYSIIVQASISSVRFKTYLDALNECFLRYGQNIKTVSFRSDELLICR